MSVHLDRNKEAMRLNFQEQKIILSALKNKCIAWKNKVGLLTNRDQKKLRAEVLNRYQTVPLTPTTVMYLSPSKLDFYTHKHQWLKWVN